MTVEVDLDQREEFVHKTAELLLLLLQCVSFESVFGTEKNSVEWLINSM